MKWREYAAPPPAAIQNGWPAAIKLVAATWAGILLLFWRDAADMSMIWWNSSTFNHCLLIIPIILWLIMQRKAEVARLLPQPWWPALGYFAAGAFGWLLGDAAGVAAARQLGLIMMLQGSAATLLGPNATRGLLFPLFYMFFLLPIGEEAVPALQTLTAKMCMILLGWAGVPAHIDGIFISTSAGLFRVAEACSGVKFLIAMVALGALVCNLCFNSWRRRMVFMAACFVVPVAANGIRAFATIYVAEFRGIESAAGFDHVFYGWIFFGIVIAIIIGGAWKYFDKSGDVPAFDPANLQSPVRFKARAYAALAGLAAIALSPALWSAAVAAQTSALPQNNRLPQPAGWQMVSPKAGHRWSPRFDGASQRLFARYRNRTGQNVDLFIAIYDRQEEGREIVGYGQGAVDPKSDWSWVENRPAPAMGKAERITAQTARPAPVSREVVSFYRTGGVTSGSPRAIKFATLKARLLGGPGQAVAILVSAEYRGNRSPRAGIDAFINDLGNIDNLADQLAGVR